MSDLLSFFLEIFVGNLAASIQNATNVSTGQKRQREDRGGPASKKAYIVDSDGMGTGC